MGKCFGSWAKILIDCNKPVAFFFVFLYIAISKYPKLVSNVDYWKVSIW